MLLVLREQKPPARAHLVLNIRRNPSAKRFRSSLSGHSKSKFLPPLDDCRVRYKSEFFDVPAFRRTSDLMPTETPMTSFILRDDSNFTVDLFFLPFCQYSTFRPWSSQMVRSPKFSGVSTSSFAHPPLSVKDMVSLVIFACILYSFSWGQLVDL